MYLSEINRRKGRAERGEERSTDAAAPLPRVSVPHLVTDIAPGTGRARRRHDPSKAGLRGPTKGDTRLQPYSSQTRPPSGPDDKAR